MTFDVQAIATARDRFLSLIGTRPVIMGIVNVTPDSFSDGGLFATREAALAQAQRLVGEGADIVDVGAEFDPSWPHAAHPRRGVGAARAACSPRWWLRPARRCRSTPTRRRRRGARSRSASVSSTTCGACSAIALMAPTIAQAGAAVVIMHNRETTEPQIDIVADMKRFFAGSLEIARRAGVPERHILLDPGIGFGKSREQNYQALRAVPDLLTLGFPLLVGVSRKSIFKGLGDGVLEGRLVGTLAANLLAARDGAQVFRVHDAAEHRAAFEVMRILAAPSGG